MSLAKLYCKEVLRELKEIPVYIPGRLVQIGDIIEFERRNVPIGNFKYLSNLKSFGIEPSTRTDPDPDPYSFTSKNGVSTSFTADVDLPGSNNGELEVSFSREGSSFFRTIDCATEQVEDAIGLQKAIREKSGELDWGNYFIVIGVTIAARAIVMQSSSSEGSLTLKGEVKGLEVGSTKISADAQLQIKKTKDAAFIKDWSENVAIFMKLLKYRSTRDKFIFESSSMDNYEFVEVNPFDLAEYLDS